MAKSKKQNVIKQYDIFQSIDNIPNIKIINQFDLEDFGVHDAIKDLDFFFDKMEILCDVLQIHSMESEHLFAIAIGRTKEMKGIYLMGIGTPFEVSCYSNRNLAMFLLLIGAVEFFTIHNHPNNILEASDGDAIYDMNIKGLAIALGINCKGNYAVTRKGYVDLYTKEVVIFEEV